MRYLAITRFRLLTTIRSATWVFAIAVAPPLIAALVESSMPELIFRKMAESFYAWMATAAVAVWAIHAGVLFAACEAFGSVKGAGTALTSPKSDLMETAPVSLGARFWGEALGILATVMTIHVAVLPLLALVVALSPLPTRIFLFAEAAILAALALGSSAAAWKRRARRTKWSGTRGARSFLLFGIFLLLTIMSTTRWDDFRDNLGLMATRPSPRAWQELAAAVENPLLLTLMLTLLFAGYLGFYYASSVQPARD